MQILCLLLFITWKKLETLQIFTETQSFKTFFFLVKYQRKMVWKDFEATSCFQANFGSRQLWATKKSQDEATHWEWLIPTQDLWMDFKYIQYIFPTVHWAAVPMAGDLPCDPKCSGPWLIALASLRNLSRKAGRTISFLGRKATMLM